MPVTRVVLVASAVLLLVLVALVMPVALVVLVALVTPVIPVTPVVLLVVVVGLGRFQVSDRNSSALRILPQKLPQGFLGSTYSTYENLEEVPSIWGGEGSHLTTSTLGKYWQSPKESLEKSAKMWFSPVFLRVFGVNAVGRGVARV